MTIGLFAWGSRRDVQPFLVLAVRLKNEGYDVRLFASENFKKQIESFQIRFTPLYRDNDAILYSAEGKKY